MKFIQFIAQLIGFVFHHFDPPPVSEDTPVESSEEIVSMQIPVEIDPRIIGLEDAYFWQMTRDFRNLGDSNPPDVSTIIDDMGKNACHGRIQIEKIQGIKIRETVMHTALVTTGRVEIAVCKFEFVDEDEKNFVALPKREDVRFLRENLAKRIKRFTN